MSKVTGILERATTNDAGYCSIYVGGKWHSTYRDDHTDKKGSMVEFEATDVTKNGRTYSNAKGVKVLQQAAPAAASGAPMAPDARQSSIVMQSSFRTAADIITAAVQADALALGSKKADKMDILLAYVDDVAKALYHKCMDPTDFLNDGEEDPAAPPSDGWDPTEA